MPEEDELAAAIFGHSDSDLSSDEDDVAPTHAPPEDSSGDSADEYKAQKKRAPTKRRAKGRRNDEEEEGRTTQRKRKRASTKKKVPAEDIDWSQYPPEVVKKMKLDMKIEEILRPWKSARARRRRKDDEDVLDRFADEEVSRLKESMMAAAADDEQANREKLPAVSKLRLLPQVMEILRKSSLSQSIQDNNLLEGVRRWLEPLPDKSLPALDIQREFFAVLKKMDYIDTAVLKESRVGRIVLFYTKCKRVTPDIQRAANDLVATWSRPIIKRSASYRDRVVPTAQLDDGTGPGGRGPERLNAILARARESDKNRVRKNAVMIPQRELGSYTVAPRSSAGFAKTNASVEVDTQRRKQNAERLKSLTKKMSSRS